MAIVERRRSKPRTAAEPSWTGSNVLITRMVVVLPAPFGPSSPKTSPRSTQRSIPSTAILSAKRWRSPLTRNAGPASPGWGEGAGSAIRTEPLDLPLQFQEDTDRAAQPALIVDRQRAHRLDEEAHPAIAKSPHFAAQVLRQVEPGHPSVGLLAAAHHEAGIDQLPDEGAHRVGSQSELLGHLVHRNAGTATEEPHQLELGARELRQLLWPACLATPAAAYGAHGRQQLVRQEVKAVVGPARRRPARVRGPRDGV